MAIPVATCELLGTFLETLGFGIYLMISPQCLRITLQKKLAIGLKIYLLTTMALIFIFAGVHIVVDFTRIFQAFTANMDVAGAPDAYFANVNTALNLTKNSAYTSATIVADALLVYRTFVVWGRNYLIAVIPTCILMVDFAMSVWFTWSVNEARPGSSVLASTVFARSKYFLIATLVLNLLCTFLISFRIWRIHSQVSHFQSMRPGANALSIIVESAAIYSAVTIVLIACSITDVAPFFFFLNSMPPLIGVVFSYIILRSSSEDRRAYDTTTLKFGNSIVFGNSTASGTTAGNSQQNPSSVQKSNTQGVHITLQQIVRRDDVDVEQLSAFETLQDEPKSPRSN